MTTREFTIHGNQDDPEGNPIPKIRLTGNQQWTHQAQRYAAWKQYVQAAYCRIHLKKWKGPFGESAAKQKPIVLKKMQHASMHISIWWADEKHGDPESIFGSIADAIFQNDKHITDIRIFSFHSSNKKGRVDVKITY